MKLKNNGFSLYGYNGYIYVETTDEICVSLNYRGLSRIGIMCGNIIEGVDEL